MIEILEPRIAPAVLVNAATKTATWTDYDGDLVKVKWTGAAMPGFSSIPKGVGDVVDRFDFLNAGFNNSSVIFTVKAVPGGDGVVNVGRFEL